MAGVFSCKAFGAGLTVKDAGGHTNNKKKDVPAMNHPPSDMITWTPLPCRE